MNPLLYKDVLNTKISPLIPAEILSRESYISNILYGRKRISAFEMIPEYNTPVASIQSSPVSSQLHDVQISQQASR